MATNTTLSGTGPGSVSFVRNVNVLHIGVQDSSIGISVDGGQHYISLPIGFHTLHIGIIIAAVISGQGSWQIMADYEII